MGNLLSNILPTYLQVFTENKNLDNSLQESEFS